MKSDNKECINFGVMSKSIILIQDDGEKLTLTNQEAQKLAQDRELDLIEISINKQTDTSICKIADYSKFRYAKQKKDKLTQKQQRESKIDTKEIQLGVNIEERDVEIKAKRALEFLDKGARIRVILQMRNRELSHKDVGEAVMKRFLTFITDANDIEKPLHNEGNNLVVVLYRKKK
jgi:translation initiation factor IF-3